MNGAQLVCKVDEGFMLFSFAFDGAGDDGDVSDASLLHGVHDAGECAEGDALIGAQVNDFLCVWAAGVAE